MSLLVNYENSDDEDNDNDDQNDENEINANKNNNHNTVVISDNSTEETASANLFKKLPAPAADHSADDSEEMIILPTDAELKLREVPPARAKRKIVISLLSVEDSDSDDEKTVQPAPKHFHHGSSLFALLPEPSTISKAFKQSDHFNPSTNTSNMFKPKSTNTAMMPRTLNKNTTTTATTTTVITANGVSINSSVTTCTVTTNTTTMSTTTSSVTATALNTTTNLNLKPSSSNAIKDETTPPIMPKNPNFLGLIGSYDDDDEENDNFSDVDDDELKKFKEDEHTTNKISIDDIANEHPTISLQPRYFVGNDDDDDDDDGGGNPLGRKTIHSAALYNYSDLTPSDGDQIQAYGDVDDVDDNDDHQKDGDGDAGDVTSILTKEQLERLQGRPNKKQESCISLIDVKIADHIGQYELDRTKNISIDADKVSYSKKGDGQPTSQQRRKHQITYLAHQAKEREFELKNQWAENRFNKRQTQSKYGF